MMMTVFDMFSGFGGFHQAVEKAGMKVIAYCEINKWAKKLYRHKGELVTAFSIENKQAILYKAALEEIRTACQYYIADERDLTPEQIIVMINEVLNG